MLSGNRGQMWVNACGDEMRHAGERKRHHGGQEVEQSFDLCFQRNLEIQGKNQSDERFMFDR